MSPAGGDRAVKSLPKRELSSSPTHHVPDPAIRLPDKVTKRQNYIGFTPEQDSLPLEEA